MTLMHGPITHNFGKSSLLVVCLLASDNLKYLVKDTEKKIVLNFEM